MMLVRTFVAPSEIQGLGVFAGEFIPGGSHLWVLNPKFDIFLYREEIATLPAHMQDYVARYSYPHFEIDPEFRGFGEKAIDVAISAMQAGHFRPGAVTQP